MVSGCSVSAHADVPVADASGATTCDRLARCWRTSRRPGRGECCVKQRDHVLLVQRPGAERTPSDVEGTVLPEHVVIQLWVRDLGAIRMAAGAGDAAAGQVRQ